MAQKTQGPRNKTRKKLTRHVRDKETLSDHLKEFETGDRVLVQIDSSIHKGLPHPRFHGKSGTVVEPRGRSYIVEIKDRGKPKQIPIYTAHLREV